MNPSGPAPSTPAHPLAEFRLATSVDWVHVRVTFHQSTHHRHVRRRMESAGLIPGHVDHVDAPHDKPARVIATRIQDPGTPAEFMRKIQALAPHGADPIRERDIEILGVEIALDAKARTLKDHANLANVAAHFIHHLAHPPSENIRITPGANLDVSRPQNLMAYRCALRDGWSVNIGNQVDPCCIRAYVKNYDSNAKDRYAALGNWRDHSGRIEVTLSGGMCPITTVQQWRSFKFESLARHFAMVKPKGTLSPTHLNLLDWQAQLGTVKDTNGKAQNRRMGRTDTCRDTALNQRIADALRALTKKTKSAGIHENADPSKPVASLGTGLKDRASAKY